MQQPAACSDIRSLFNVSDVVTVPELGRVIISEFLMQGSLCKCL